MLRRSESFRGMGKDGGILRKGLVYRRYLIYLLRKEGRVGGGWGGSRRS